MDCERLRMFSTDDTIVGMATPPGRGGIGVVRVSGSKAHEVARQLAAYSRPFRPRYATVVRLSLPGGLVDRAVVTAFVAPHSYTGEHVAEISAHGSPVLLQAIVRGAMDLGARLAEPGEFTYRAFLHGRMDLVQAEAVRDLVHAVTPLQARAAYDQLEGTLTRDIHEIDQRLFHLCARLEASLDFPEEGYHFVDREGAADEIAAIDEMLEGLLADAARGRLVREGLQVVLAGRPNSGKSSLFNRIAGAGRAIVTATPGTTRDLIAETVDIDGVPVTLVDTAGVRQVPGDAVEAEGIARAAAAREVAAAVVVVLDGSVALDADDLALLEDTKRLPRLVVANKSDLPPAWSHGPGVEPALWISALTGAGVHEMRAGLLPLMAEARPARDVPAVTNLRHADLLGRARGALERARASAAAGLPEEIVLEDLGDARTLLEEVTGRRTPDDVLGHIFSTFCIGK